MVATIIAAMLNVILNYIFINLFGYMAAAYTTLFCNIVLAIAQYYMAKKVNGDLPFDAKKLWALSIVVSIIVLSCNFFYNFDVVRYLIMGIIVFAFVIKRNYFLNIIKQIVGKDRA